MSVRLIGVDTPETVHPSARRGIWQEASRFTTNLLKGERVYLLSEGDSIERIVAANTAYLFRYPDGLFVNLEIIRQGYGNAYTDIPFKYMDLFGHTSNGQENLEGLWGEEK